MAGSDVYLELCEVVYEHADMTEEIEGLLQQLTDAIERQEGEG